MYFRNKLNCFLMNSSISKYEKKESLKIEKNQLPYVPYYYLQMLFSQTRTEGIGGGLSPRAFYLGACLVTNGSSASKHAASNPRSYS